MNKLLMFFMLVGTASASCGNKANNFCSVKVVDVYDGDTFYVDLPKLHTLFGKRLGIRVKGVDTPEMRGGSAYEKVMAKKAKEFTRSKLASAKKVDLTECSRGKYFRIVCNVMIDGKSLTEMLISSQLAVPYAK